jgi:Spy/CpxP family protein refolding chaperone
MTARRILLVSALLTSGAGFLAAPAIAAPRDCGSATEHRDFLEHRAERLEQEQKKLHEVLKLTANQESAWKALVAAESPAAKAELWNRDEWAKLSTPEREEKRLEQAKAHQQRLSEHLAALKDFYAVLTPEQKKTFDEFHSSRRAGKHGDRPQHPDVAPNKP